MNPETPPPPTTPAPLVNLEPGEQMVCEIKRHPFGLIGMYFMAALLIIVLALAAIFVPHFFTSIDKQVKLLLLLGFAIIAAFVFLLIFVSTSIYNKNRWIVTSSNLTEVTQEGLFRRQVSQLSLANLEDVTTNQSGIIQSMFHFGTLRAETAGETSHFVLSFCPNPNGYAQKILAAREAFLRNSPDVASRANDKLNVPGYTPPAATTPAPVTTPPPVENTPPPPSNDPNQTTES